MTTELDQLQLLYSYAKAACESRISKATAGRELNQQAGIPRGSAGNMIQDLRHMLSGSRYQRRLNATVTEYFLGAIHRDFGDSGLERALKALWGHIEYVEDHYHGKSRANREIHGRFSTLLERTKGRSSERLSVKMLSKVSAEHIWLAVQGLEGRDAEGTSLRRVY